MAHHDDQSNPSDTSDATGPRYSGRPRHSGAEVIVECFGVRLRDGSLVGRRADGLMVGDPDRLAADVIGLTASPLDGVAVLHSTSWRWRASGGIVLTYLCCPDPLSIDGAEEGRVVVPADSHAAVFADPSRPASPDVSDGDVLHHGIDHLAWLADHFADTVQPSQSVAPELWAAIGRAGRHRAGRFGSAASEHERR